MGSFKDVVGHKDVINYIQNSVAEGHVSHAYIINGERGTGKKMLAKLFAMALLCESGEAEPCNTCHSCIQAESNNHPDIIWVNHEKPTSIGVEDVRDQINNTVDIKPYQGPYKVYIVSEADLMTVQAQNALLKTIEEPPQYVVIILLTENAEVLLPTITSRCIMLKLRNIKDTLIKKYLMENLEIPDYKAEVCAAFAQGNMGKAIKLATSEHFNELKDEVLQLMRHIHDMEISEIVAAVNRCSLYKFEISDYLDLIMVWYRDVLLYKATMEIDRIIFKDELEYMRKQARRSSYEGIELILESLDKAKARLKANVNFDLVMELLFLTIKEN